VKVTDWRDYRDPELFFTPLPEPLRLISEQLGQAFEKEFGVQRLPWDVALKPVPLFAEFNKPPQTLLLHALFDTEPANIPRAARPRRTWRRTCERGRRSWAEDLAPRRRRRNSTRRSRAPTPLMQAFEADVGVFPRDSVLHRPTPAV
jgi:hypothetical protein